MSGVRFKIAAEEWRQFVAVLSDVSCIAALALMLWGALTLF